MSFDSFQLPAFMVIYIGLPTFPPPPPFFFSPLALSPLSLVSHFYHFSPFFFLPPGLPLAFYFNPFRQMKMSS